MSQLFHMSPVAADLRIIVHETGMGTLPYSDGTPTGNVQISIPGVGQVIISPSQARSLAYHLTEVRRSIEARQKLERSKEDEQS